MDKYILVTGGLGFIGSHICVDLINNGYGIVIIDNLSNSKLDVLKNIRLLTDGNYIPFYKWNVCDSIDVIFSNFNIYAVIHLAGLKSVSESIKNPLNYYKNNLTSTINLLSSMNKYNCNRLIFSSSATVYGSQQSPLREDMDIGIGINNPYGQSKFMIEKILKDQSSAYPDLKIISLRYFNPIGAHPSGKIGEDPNSRPNNLMPYILRVVFKNNINKKIEGYDELSVFGDTYNTPDGTCIRDYIHVCDLSKGHLLALKKIDTLCGYEVFNLGQGKGYSVLDVINCFKKVNKVKLPYSIIEKRVGDIDVVYCDIKKSKKLLNFKTEYDIEKMCIDSWNFQKNIII